MKKKYLFNIFYIIIGGAINILCTAILPDLFISLFNLNLEKRKLSIIIGFVVLVILFLLKIAIFSDNKEFDSIEFIQDSNKDYKEIIKIREIKILRIYSISSAYWHDIFSRYQSLKIDHCIIMVRNDKRLSSELYENELSKSVEKWKKLVEEKRINRLEIIEYDNIPDINYVIIDKIALICGLNLFCKNDSTYQRGDRSPLHIYGDNEIKKIFIEKYIEHFDNYNQYYIGNVIYDNFKNKQHCDVEF